MFTAALALQIGALQAQQNPVKLDLNSFEGNKGSWSEVGKVWADPTVPNELQAADGSGVFANLPTKKKPGADLISIEKFGDVDLSLEFMVAPNSNSGVYLQGNYEIQILDSWTSTASKPGDNGGIYQRWDESKPDGQKGYQGYAPRQNASKAPGVWQKLDVSFQAAKFNSNGEKIENARFLYVALNGVTIHENLEVFGPTRGSLTGEDVAEGPLRIQGDHGAVAFRNVVITPYDAASPKISNVSYETFQGSFNNLEDLSGKTAKAKGTVASLNEIPASVSGVNLTKIDANLNVAETGEYFITLQVPGGLSGLAVGNETVSDLSNRGVRIKKQLNAGDNPIHIIASKNRNWSVDGFNLYISGPGLRNTELLVSQAGANQATDPILVDASETPVLRSFRDFPDFKRLSHVVSVASEEKVNYAYDMETGTLIQVWRGEFLDATPMWNSRGNGVSVPQGALINLSTPAINAVNADYQTSEEFRTKGYQLKNGSEDMVFNYLLSGNAVTDEIKVLESGKGISRTVSGIGNGFYKVADGVEIQKVAKGYYLLPETGVYLQYDEGTYGAPVTNSSNDESGIFLPAKGNIVYNLLF
ncbi:probable large multifunctional protein-putative glycosyl hydrolase [Algoriphagus machipongonensis]|uniref:Probable large multifunctional protein-putative glycosyl hydrolase n=1 Tax=Algoriphagus machipongonensis TaxID=388413 RepID=A3I193_9BACT|nr:probable large multifunctional protein-putative glycosyl hydrolase [Algoriphagus machipongonensis]